tara:strand:+ start:252 stop:1094 length:843 start_codon:yes stop_codon:yes gene_type:complete
MESSNDKSTVVSFVLDESGSMQRNCRDTIEGFNEYIGELKGDPDPTLICLQTFNSTGFKKLFRFKNVDELVKLSGKNFNPAGRTPLLDAVGLAIRETEEFLSQSSDEPQVIMTIMTDGRENASRKYSSAQIQKMIEGKKRQGWTFTYLGANHDAWHAGRGLGIDPKYVSRFSAADPKSAFRRSARSTLNFKQISSLLRDSVARRAKCPGCDSGIIQQRKDGLYSCSDSIECGWSTSYTPLSRPSCPHCERILFWIRRGTKIVCLDETCGYEGDLIENYWN